jgi:hypothetical protein
LKDGPDDEWTNLYTVDAYHAGNVSQIVFRHFFLLIFPPVVHEILGRYNIVLPILTAFTELCRITRAIRTAGFTRATSTKETFRSRSLLSSPSEISNLRRKSASTIKGYILEMKMTRRNHHQKRKMMMVNQRTRSTQNVFAEQRIAEVIILSPS